MHLLLKKFSFSEKSCWCKQAQSNQQTNTACIFFNVLFEQASLKKKKKKKIYDI
jgi:hypothetical protein